MNGRSTFPNLNMFGKVHVNPSIDWVDIEQHRVYIKSAQWSALEPTVDIEIILPCAGCGEKSELKGTYSFDTPWSAVIEEMRKKHCTACREILNGGLIRALEQESSAKRDFSEFVEEHFRGQQLDLTHFDVGEHDEITHPYIGWVVIPDGSSHGMWMPLWHSQERTAIALHSFFDLAATMDVKVHLHEGFMVFEPIYYPKASDLRMARARREKLSGHHEKMKAHERGVCSST